MDHWLLLVFPPPGRSASLDALMIAASTAGLLGLALGIPWWLLRRDRALGRATVGTMLAGLGVTLVLQLLVQRPRPAVAAPLLPLPPLPSFPSGHAVLVTIAVIMLAVHRRRLGLALLPVAALVAVSRVHVGHHHLSDVLGGGVMGLGLAAGAVVRARAAPRDPWRLRWVLWPQLGVMLAISVAAYAGALARGDLVWLRLPGMDKALHFVSFGLLALTTCFAARDRTLSLGPLRLPVAVLWPMLGALVEELIQGVSPYRTADPLDLLADLLGMIAFWRLARWIAATSVRKQATPALDPPRDLP